MDSYVPWTKIHLLAFLTILVFDNVVARNLRNITDNSEIFYRCLCRVYTGDDQLIHDFGVLESYPHWPSSDCHYLHKRCRVKCGMRLDLESYTDRSEAKVKLGLDYCQRYGRVTSNSGVTLRARWETEGCPHHAWITSKKHTPLCCGYTTIPSHNGNSLLTFGWNPDCQAQTFLIGS